MMIGDRDEGMTFPEFGSIRIQNDPLSQQGPHGAGTEGAVLMLLLIQSEMLKSRGWWGPAHGGTHTPKMPHRDGADLGDGASLRVVQSTQHATMNREVAIRVVMAEFASGSRPVKMGGREYFVSTTALRKMTAALGEGGVKKPYQRERIVAIQSLAELAGNAKVVYRPDDDRDPDVERIAEGRVLLRHGDTSYLVRLLGKVWKPTANKQDKMHSLAIEDVIVERSGTDQSSLGAGSSLRGDAGIDKLGKSGNHLSASAAFDMTIPDYQDDSMKKSHGARILFLKGDRHAA